MDNTPKEGITTQVEVVRVVDGDTIEVEVRRRFKVRISHPTDYRSHIFDTPEKGTILGDAVTAYTKWLLDTFKGKIRLFIPSGQSIDLMDFNSFNRILGEIWLDDRRLSSILLEKGFARIISKSKRTKTPWKTP